MQESQVQSLGWEDPLEKEMATHSSILAWRVPWTGEPGGYSPWGHSQIQLSQKQHTHTHTVNHWIKFLHLCGPWRTCFPSYWNVWTSSLQPSTLSRNCLPQGMAFFRGAGRCLYLITGWYVEMTQPPKTTFRTTLKGHCSFTAPHGVGMGFVISTLQPIFSLSAKSCFLSFPHVCWSQGTALINFLKAKFHLRLCFPGTWTTTIS